MRRTQASHTEFRLARRGTIAVAALCLYALSLLPVVPAISGVTGPVLCFVLTGVAGASAIFPGRVGPVIRLTTAFSFALGSGIVGGLILNLFAPGLDRPNWLTYALVVTLISYAIARTRTADHDLYWEIPKFSVPSWTGTAKAVTAALLVLAAVLLSVSSRNAADETFTEFWLVPNGPTHSTTNATGAVLGVKNHETAAEDYTVVVDTGLRVMTSRMTLLPDQVWTRDVPVEGRDASATLYRDSRGNQPYRRVWIDTR